VRVHDAGGCEEGAAEEERVEAPPAGARALRCRTRALARRDWGADLAVVAAPEAPQERSGSGDPCP